MKRSKSLLGYAYYGASRMKWYFQKPYVRVDPNSLLHYPETSHIDSRKVDYLYDEPKSGYEGALIYGPNTLELTNLPMGKTPEYLQDRLRRFFSVFGLVTSVRCMPHPLDPYQCSGTGYVTFRSREASIRAAVSNLVFPPSLCSKIINIRHLDTDKTNDPLYINKQRHYAEQIIHIVRSLYYKLIKTGSAPLSAVYSNLYERDFSGKIRVAGISILVKYNSWASFFNSPFLSEIFLIHDDRVYLRLHCEKSLNRILHSLKFQMEQDLQESLRVDCPDPPPERRRGLDEELQILSRSTRMYRIHDERFIYKLKLKRERNLRRKEYRESKANNNNS